jgi:hypothetical protein
MLCIFKGIFCAFLGGGGEATASLAAPDEPLLVQDISLV